MTDQYHPVTREELYMIKNDCDCSRRKICDYCKYDDIVASDENVVSSKQIMDEVLSRPDPLALLEAWRKWRMYDMDTNFQEDWDEEDDFIKQLRINPSAVRDEGIAKGWWKE
jgi:hypothetical protein